MSQRRFLLFLLLLCAPLFLLAQESTAVLCSDGIDNDGDGLIDCMDQECVSLPNQGCITCFEDGLSFADTLLDYQPRCPSNENEFPLRAIGVSDAGGHGFDVSLGEGGSITLGFTNNLVVNSSDNDPDIWVFEVGFRVESSTIELRPFDQATLDILIAEGTPDADGNGFFDFGQIAGATSSLDIDAIVSGYAFADLKFDAIKITDVPEDCGGRTPGADIDAVCALSSIEVDCAGVINGSAQLDNCGRCLDPNDPMFNECPDCAGVINGPALIDGCGNCLDPADPLFNDCLDCAGTPDGLAIIDSCGQCLLPSDPAFNDCIDCAGVLNGPAMIDGCGNCLDPADPLFDDCLDCAGTPDGLAVLDSCGQCLPPSDPAFNDCLDCADVPNGLAMIDSCGNCLDPADPFFNDCLDCAGIPFGNAIIDSCGNCLAPSDAFFNRLCDEDKLIYVPNVFTPNADGFNDSFEIFALQGYVRQVRQYIIFNRWGGIVHQAANFELTDRTRWWYGLPNAMEQEMGVYVYFIELELYNGERRTLQGDVTLLK
ncbi:MAG: gliding motility-associated C-terminal domain-containing protein [Bacteroidota bacterium]